MRYWLLGVALVATGVMAPNASAFHPRNCGTTSRSTGVIGVPTHQVQTFTTGVVTTGIVSSRVNRTAVVGSNALVLSPATSFLNTNLVYSNVVSQPLVYQVEFRNGGGGKDDTPPTNKADPELTKAMAELTKALAENKTAIAELTVKTNDANILTAAAMKAAMDAKKKDQDKDPATNNFVTPTAKDYKETLALIERLTEKGTKQSDEALKEFNKANAAYEEHTEAIKKMKQYLKLQ